MIWRLIFIILTGNLDFGRVQSESIILFCMYGVGDVNQIPITAWCLLSLKAICSDSLERNNHNDSENLTRIRSFELSVLVIKILQFTLSNRSTYILVN